MLYRNERSGPRVTGCTFPLNIMSVERFIHGSICTSNGSFFIMKFEKGGQRMDNPLNSDGIGDKEILVVSFGTSFNDSRIRDIKGIEDAFIKAFPDWSVRRAFTSQMIIDHILRRDGEKIDNMPCALERAADNGVKDLIIQPTHLMQGEEYDKIVGYVEKYKEKFRNVQIAAPLLGEVGIDDQISNSDKKAVADILVSKTLEKAGYRNIDHAIEEETALVFLGHGTWHDAKISYSQMQLQMKQSGYENVFIGTVEGEPENTACERVLEEVKRAGYKKVILRPMMVVAGDHANNDMAGEEEDSWLRMFERSQAFEQVDVQINGLGEIPEIQELYIAHTKALL